MLVSRGQRGNFAQSPEGLGEESPQERQLWSKKRVALGPGAFGMEEGLLELCMVP